MGAVVVMGVAGCGKSSVAVAVATALQWPLIEGDDFHSDANREKMRSGVPLSDDDRHGWLIVLGEQLKCHPAGAVLTCSALKRRYRDLLREASPGLRFAWLELSQASALARVAQRASHFFPSSVVASQFEALEPPTGEPGVLPLDALLPLDELSRQVLAWMSAPPAR
jgi:gluconokinase